MCAFRYTLMRVLMAFLLSALASMPMHAANQRDLQRLDEALDQRDSYTQRKLQHIDYLKAQLKAQPDSEQQLRLYDQLFDEYYVFKFDSARYYVDIALTLSRKLHKDYYIKLNLLRQAQLYAIGCLYSEAIEVLDNINIEGSRKDLKLQYYLTYFILYSNWANYCSDDRFSPIYAAQARDFLKQAMPFLEPSMSFWDYYHGEYYIYVERNDKKALYYYFRTIRRLSKHSRYYAMASFAIANNYSAHGDQERYEQYLIEAAISDAICCTRENLALQDLATYLFREDNNNIERADRYINIAMEDAKFFNARLRILEISQKMPTIVASYEQQMMNRNNTLKWAIVVISLLVLGSLLAILYIFRQNKLLTNRRHQLSQSNSKLTELNFKLTELNSRLAKANTMLVDTNRKRERLAKLYIDLCAKFIDLLAHYQTFVQRKIKANQVSELLSKISSSRLSEEEAEVFRNRFDKAFLDLYPTFTTELNALLEPEHRIANSDNHSMTSEQRIYALIRLGVKESSEIASVLFYSPQTIYNYRSRVKNWAVNKETFEEDIMKIGTIIQ